MDPRLYVFLAAITAASAFNAAFESCSEKCTVSEVRIEPCKSLKYCLFRLGSNASISFDFTPNFSATELETAIYSDEHHAKLTSIGNNGIVNACLHTPCPLEPGRQQTFNFTLYIGKKLPPAKYQFRWQVWNKNNEEEFCCLKTNIKLKK